MNQSFTKLALSTEGNDKEEILNENNDELPQPILDHSDDVIVDSESNRTQEENKTAIVSGYNNNPIILPALNSGQRERVDIYSPAEIKKRITRKRVSQACALCRKKKIRCDGVHPACSICIEKGLECYYLEKKKRGRPSKSGDKVYTKDREFIENIARKGQLGPFQCDIEIRRKYLYNPLGGVGNRDFRRGLCLCGSRRVYDCGHDCGHFDRIKQEPSSSSQLLEVGLGLSRDIQSNKKIVFNNFFKSLDENYQRICSEQEYNFEHQYSLSENLDSPFIHEYSADMRDRPNSLSPDPIGKNRRFSAHKSYLSSFDDRNSYLCPQIFIESGDLYDNGQNDEMECEPNQNDPPNLPNDDNYDSVSPVSQDNNDLFFNYDPEVEGDPNFSDYVFE
ncbi:hypothetical protein BB560_000599 [Smittium megazygosporum]|uniref:Zn(2)-C6 fungal-type domain-containing protein n=1 Tax=Smittium megazygosporum TaxID=133381 RepID=A0A2T9ZJZ8_9FUNG|nr:hypothetical protein BB560_000599 [Smittium megazygosporum]